VGSPKNSLFGLGPEKPGGRDIGNRWEGQRRLLAPAICARFANNEFRGHRGRRGVLALYTA
jgi:hypothetical protein